MNLGNISLFLNIISALVWFLSSIFYHRLLTKPSFIAGKQGDLDIQNRVISNIEPTKNLLIRRVYKYSRLTNCILTNICFFYLILIFCISDFGFAIVYNTSSSIKPLMYKIGASWASHEGSILLWLWLFSNVSYIATSYAKIEIEFKVVASAILSFVFLLFIIFIYFTSNPFILLQGISSEGLGLTPVLQDISLLYHPPILYIGYISLIVPYSYSIAYLITKYESQDIAYYNRLWVMLSFIFLLLGVTFGSIWAYRELGWGGFWYFDPVENASLMPLLVVTALFHMLKMKEKIWTHLLTIIAFLSSIFGTFLVRSGLLISVHSFAFSPERGYIILFNLIVITIVSLFIYFKYINKDQTLELDKFLSRKTGIIILNILLVAALTTIVTSILYPIYYQILYKKVISVGTDYFLTSFIPLMLLIGIILALFMVPEKVNLINYKILQGICLALSLINSIILNSPNFLSTLGIFSASFIISSHIVIIIKDYRKKIISIGKIAMYLGHISYGIMIFSIVMTSEFSQELDISLKAGEKAKFAGFEVKLDNIHYSTGPNYYRQVAKFIFMKDNNEIVSLSPENRFYHIEKSTNSEADIYSFLNYDLHAVINNVKDDIVNVRLYYRPFISYLWLSAFVMAFSGLLKFIRKKKT